MNTPDVCCVRIRHAGDGVDAAPLGLITTRQDRFVVMGRGQHPANPSHGEFMEGGSAMLRTVIVVLVIVILVIVLLRLV
ncbi:MAG TPA: hypothetical protein VFZ70_04680 [Euzebyales bacterium]